MKSLLVYLKDYKKESILGPLFKLLEASFELFVPLVMAAIIDNGIGNQDSFYIIKMCFIMILLGIIGLICSITAQYFAAKASVGFATKLRHSLFSHIQGFSFSDMDTLGNSTLITRMTSDINQVQSGVNLVLRLFLRSPFVVFGAMIMAFTINREAAYIFVCAIPFLSLVVFGIMLFNIPLFRKVQMNLDRVLGITRENLTGVRVIRAFNKEQEERQQFENYNQALTKIQMFAGRISALMNPFTYVIVNAAIIALIWKGAIQVNLGIITRGEVVALVNYMSQILVELVKLANLIITVTKALACAKRIETIFEVESSEKNIDLLSDSLENEVHSETENYITFSHVGFRYKGASEEALTDISFEVKRGQTIGIIGGTGSGKSSLVHLLPRFYEVTNGEIILDGRKLSDYSLAELRAKIGIVMQKAVLFKGTIRENVCWGKKEATDKEMEEALTISQAKEFVDGKKEGMEFKLEQGGRNLSGGQRQRLTIARALIKKPEILILDDSASALDFATDAKLRHSIRTMKEKPTIFIVSQRAASIQSADQILVLEDGKLVGVGNHDKLLKECLVYQEIYYSQFPKEEVTA